ncbi:maleylpyruvate isomerase family mycothiol-dependent enzyme [Nonomuraea sp. NN258]|uniref:maleylpyruvate isomerase family mycothiol-dependent enzyme n=1 Tax=Nonomuraea antri TaxID=2730852 RepID=UPI0015687717|nr:maleylpyruvate isomerase family mycothiol-dependent enzyme [Nonomuraea antri]NRQ30500.1 maleylpyruvate isomerase family mycothiol-dependent enzyme [Nonomuraea antri]
MEPVERLYLDALMEDPAVPAGSLRPQLLAGARARRRPAAPTATWAEPYAGRVAAMDALLASAMDDDWSRTIVEGWTLQELVAHLAAKDGLIAAAVGAPVLGPPLAAIDSAGRTRDVQAYERERSPEQTRRDWRAQADALCRHLAALDPGTLATLDGMEVAISDHMLARCLETWVHTDDAAKVAHVRLPHPVPQHIHPTADLCARLLPWTMLFSGLDGSGRTILLTLTGPGGGEWRMPLGISDAAPGEPEAHITADVVDFCFLLGGRRRPGGPDGIAVEIAGDQALAHDVIATAPALSGP